MEWVSAAVSVILDFYTWAIILRAIMSWVRPERRSPAYQSVERGLYRATEPVLRPIRQALGTGAGVDFSPAVALLLIYLVRRVAFMVLPKF